MIDKVIKAVKNPRLAALVMFEKKDNRNMPDKEFLEKKTRLVTGKKLNLENPETFTEKLQWLKLFNRNPLYTRLVDKYLVRDCIKEKLGEEYLIPLLGVWNDPDDIDFDALPNQFVLKCNHNSGLGMCICKDKSKLDLEKVKSELKKGLNQDYYITGREWPYKDVPRKVVAEKFMKDDSTSELRDYKFFCFNGEPVYCQVISDRTTDETIDFYDMEWRHQPFTGLGMPKKPFSTKEIDVPVTFDKMKASARLLAKDIPFVRVDFYEINGKMYFGELTFYPAAGFGVFYPDEWNYKIGSLLKLPEKGEK